MSNTNCYAPLPDVVVLKAWIIKHGLLTVQDFLAHQYAHINPAEIENLLDGAMKLCLTKKLKGKQDE